MVVDESLLGDPPESPLGCMAWLFCLGIFWIVLIVGLAWIWPW